MKGFSFAVAGVIAFFGVILVFLYLDDQRTKRQAIVDADYALNGPCRDFSVLLASTAGSPDKATCTNKKHRMRIQLASAPSNEEFGAVAFCECEREDGGTP